jgi:hypothetical protein
LTDCISFVVMQQQALTDAVTGDRHFVQGLSCPDAGYPVESRQRDQPLHPTIRQQNTKF